MPVLVKSLLLRSMCCIEFLSANVTAISCADPSFKPLPDILGTRVIITISYSLYELTSPSKFSTGLHEYKIKVLTENVYIIRSNLGLCIKKRLLYYI